MNGNVYHHISYCQTILAAPMALKRFRKIRYFNGDEHRSSFPGLHRNFPAGILYACFGLIAQLVRAHP